MRSSRLSFHHSHSCCPLFYFTIQPPLCLFLVSLFISLPRQQRERCSNRERKRGDESPDAMWLHQIHSSSHQELICLNPSHCSVATMDATQRRIVISAAWGAAGLLHCPDIWGEKQGSMRREGKAKLERIVEMKWGRSGVAWIHLLTVLVSHNTPPKKSKLLQHDSQAEKQRQDEEVRDSTGKPVFNLPRVCLLFCLRIYVRKFGWRSLARQAWWSGAGHTR